MTVKRITFLALFTAVALIIHTLESLVPLPVPLPGIKLGLANAVTLFMLFAPPVQQLNQPGLFEAVNQQGGNNSDGGNGNGKTPAADVLIVLLSRILLGALITGRPIIIIYSMTGGLLAVTAQIITKRIVTDRQIWVCGAAGAVFHNIGQILAAAVITGTPAVVVYLPALIIAGIITGTLTGIIAGLTIKKMKNAGKV